MLIAISILLSFLCQVITNESQENSHNESFGNFLQDLKIVPFLDENFYIRLNLSWEHVEGGATEVSFKFATTEDCNQISEIHSHLLEDNQFIIVPSMDLKHPADQLIHRCRYDIVIEDDVFHNHTNQTFSYEIPECVEDKCECTDADKSPYEIDHIIPSSDNLFTITWRKLGKNNLSVHRIYYQTVNSKIRTHIPESSMTMISNGVKIPLRDLTEGVRYKISVIFTDIYDACNYFASFIFYVPERHLNRSVTLILLVMIPITIVILYMTVRRSPKMRKRLENLKHFFKHFSRRNETENIVTPITLRNITEQVNCQYTPYEFIKNHDRYDKYEIPRNRVILEEEIGGGAFGTVFRGKLYGMTNQGFTVVAVKLLREGAPQEETVDFLNEIILFKKIGEHENIIHLLACMTISQPYMMIMELVSKDSLKTYLLKIRNQWDQQKNVRIFFPDDMQENAFQDHGSKDSDGQYVEPDDVFDEPQSTCQSKSLLTKSRFRRPGSLIIKPTTSKGIKHTSPKTPTSICSSRLPSSTDTETTNVDLETPPILEMKSQPEPVLSNTELQHFAFQIASGMAYLEKQNITHRDLAARNILMTSDKTLKISDFGLSRMGPYVSNKCKKLPLRWMAIEAIENRRCDSKCDVWSFGVVLWEIGTLGAFPYDGVRDSMVLHNLKCGARLKMPEICTTDLYKLMLKCWMENPVERPTFQEIKDQLDMKKRKIYVDFDILNPSYVFPPIDEN